MPGPQPKPESKRNSPHWKAFSAFLTTDDLDRLQGIVHLVKLTGADGPADQSEALHEALQDYLTTMERHLKAVALKQLEGN